MMDIVRIPLLYTERLMLRPFEQADLSSFERLIDDRRIAEMTMNIPYPYPAGTSHSWFKRVQELINIGGLYQYAVVRRVDDTLMGSLRPNMRLMMPAE
mgnify:CR=1 FL=1